MRRLLLIIISIINYQFSISLSASASVFESAQWIGAITREQAKLPEGRNFTGAKLKESAVKEAWAAVDTLSDRSIWLRRDIQLKG